MSQKESLVDVLVIGAGPAGLMCAHGLAKFGVNVRIVDQRWVLRSCDCPKALTIRDY